MLTGTPTELVGKVRIGNVVLNSNDLSLVLKIGRELGLVKEVGVSKPKSGKGKPSTVWEIASDFAFKIEHVAQVMPNT